MAGSGTAHLRDDADILLRAENLVVEFPLGGTGLKVNAVSDVSLDVARGETLGLVGESGCGKSTTGRALIQMPAPTSGQVRYDGKVLTDMSAGEVRQVRPEMQMIFQDPISSLNPRRKVGDIVAEPLRIWNRGTAEEQRALVHETLEAVGIDPESAVDRRPHQFSGGQCQRICIARALMLDPKLIICDEPVSALDVSVQAQILNLLEDMKQRYGLTLVFIAHDLAVVKNVSDRVAVMYLGKLCEVADPDDPLRPSGPPLHRGTPRVDPRPRSERHRGDRHPHGRAPLTGGAPQRVSLQDPLPDGPGPLRAGRAGHARGRPRSPRGLPLPARDRPRTPAAVTADDSA